MRIRYGELKNEWASYYSQWPFEWWVALSFKDPPNQKIAKKRVTVWIRELCVNEHLQIACVAVFNELGRGHLHLLMFGRNKTGKTLKHVSLGKWSRNWGGNALIKPVNNLMGVSSYLARNLVLKNPDLSDVFLYNRKLLKKWRV